MKAEKIVFLDLDKDKCSEEATERCPFRSSVLCLLKVHKGLKDDSRKLEGKYVLKKYVLWESEPISFKQGTVLVGFYNLEPWTWMRGGMKSSRYRAEVVVFEKAEMPKEKGA